MIQKHTSNLHVIFWDMHQTRLASFISNRVKPQRVSLTNDVYRTSKQAKTFEDEKNLTLYSSLVKSSCAGS